MEREQMNMKTITKSVVLWSLDAVPLTLGINTVWAVEPSPSATPAAAQTESGK
jgi:hypothetical protein